MAFAVTEDETERDSGAVNFLARCILLAVATISLEDRFLDQNSVSPTMKNQAHIIRRSFFLIFYTILAFSNSFSILFRMSQVYEMLPASLFRRAVILRNFYALT